jgi:ABC-type glycerol-3-phosphate transport system substrate-binding protein
MFSRPILLLLAAALLSGALIVVRPRPQRADLTIWVFSADHARALTSPYYEAAGKQPSLVDQFQRIYGKRVAVELIGGRGLDTRLLSLLSDPNPDQVRDLLPDLVEIEIGSVGQYLRAPAADVPLLPLDNYLDSHDLRQRLAPQRLASWSRDGIVFGLPLDMHPVALVYRRDLFLQAGVELGAANTWPALRSACQRFTDYWQAHSFPQRIALSLHRSSPDDLLMMLQQRHINLIDTDGRLHLDDPQVAQTLAFYATLVATPDHQPPIAADPTPGPGRWADDLARGDRCAALVPDWALSDLRGPPALFGKYRIRPLPCFDPTDSPTATWGGTAAVIPRNPRDPESSFQLLHFLYCSPEAAEARYQNNPDVLSAFPDQWTEQSMPINPFVSDNWNATALLVGLARQLPRRTVSPFDLLANLELSKALAATVAARQAGADEQTLTRIAADSLRQGSAELRQQIDFEKLAP